MPAPAIGLHGTAIYCGSCLAFGQKTQWFSVRNESYHGSFYTHGNRCHRLSSKSSKESSQAGSKLLLPASLLPGPASIPEDLLLAHHACTHHCRLCMIVRTLYTGAIPPFFMLQIGQRTDTTSPPYASRPPDVASFSFGFQNWKMSAGARSRE